MRRLIVGGLVSVAALLSLDLIGYVGAKTLHAGGSNSVVLPSAPVNLQLVNQGGPNNNNNNANITTYPGQSLTYSSTSTQNYDAISWSPATAGSNSISSYEVFRNGSLYDTVTAPITITGCISDGATNASGTVFVVSSVSGGTSTHGDGKILPGYQLNSAAGGFTTGTIINQYTTAVTGEGGTGTYSVQFSQHVGTSTGASCTTPATFTTWGYSDTVATGVIDPTYQTAGVVYAYTVAAVDSASNVGPQASSAAYIYQGIAYNTQAQFSYGGTTPNTNSSPAWRDTTGSPSPGPYDIIINWPGQGGFLPVMGGTPSNLSPPNRLEVGAFNYLVYDIKIMDNSYLTNNLAMVPNLAAFGGLTGNRDSSNFNSINALSPTYCGTISVGVWLHCKVPFSALEYGFVNFTGSFASTGTYTGNLTATAIGTKTAVGMGTSGYITGAGLPANFYTTGGEATTGNGLTGVYTMLSPNVTSGMTIPATGTEAMVYQGTGVYKFGWQWSNCDTPVNVQITDTTGDFSYTSAPRTLTGTLTMSPFGTWGGSGSITGYASGNEYNIINVTGTTFTLQTTSGGTLTTTAGTTTGVTWCMGSNAYMNNIGFTVN